MAHPSSSLDICAWLLLLLCFAVPTILGSSYNENDEQSKDVPPIPVSLSSPQETTETSQKSSYILDLHPDGLPELFRLGALSVVYYIGKVPGRYSRFFLREFSKSAEVLRDYDVHLAVFRCKDHDDKEGMCQRDDIAQTVFVYKNGKLLTNLETEYLFDVHSIMAYVLQLVLLKEVPIVTSRLERQELQRSLVGRQDLVFINPYNLGSGAHSTFIEVAYAYHDRLRFAVTTDDKSTVGLQDNEEGKYPAQQGMWVMFCAEADVETVEEEGDCPNILFRGQLSLKAFGEFVGKLLEKSVHYAPEDGVMPLINMTSDDPVVVVYTSLQAGRQDEEILHMLTYDLRGMAQVVFVDMDDADCREAAKQQGVSGELPTMVIKTEGEPLVTLGPAHWSIADLREILLPLVFPDYARRLASTNQGRLASDEGEGEGHNSGRLTEAEVDDLIEEVESQDDAVAMAVFAMKDRELPGQAYTTDLLKDGFYRHVRKSKLLIVLFYQPFDPVSMAFLRDFGYAAQVLALNHSRTDVLAQVNCFDATELCSAENITMYPTTRIYSGDSKNFQDYKGPMAAHYIVKAVKLLDLNCPVLLTTEEQVDKFSKGHYPTDFSQFTPSSVLLLASDSFSGPTSVFNDLAKTMPQVTALGVVHPSLALALAEKHSTAVPSLIAHNREDENSPVRTLKLDGGAANAPIVSAFLRDSTILTVPELSQDNFPHLYARRQPMVVLFVDSSDRPTKDAALTSFTKLATSGRFPATVFCWMDAQAKSMGLKILSEYAWTAHLPMVSLVQHRQGKVFNYQPLGSRGEDKHQKQQKPLKQADTEEMQGQYGGGEEQMYPADKEQGRDKQMYETDREQRKGETTQQKSGQDQMKEENTRQQSDREQNRRESTQQNSEKKEDPLKEDALTKWLERVLSGKVKPSKTLDQGRWGPPGKHYDFLARRGSEIEASRAPATEGSVEDGPLDEMADTDDGTFDEEEWYEKVLEEQIEARRKLVDMRRLREAAQLSRKQHASGYDDPNDVGGHSPLPEESKIKHDSTSSMEDTVQVASSSAKDASPKKEEDRSNDIEHLEL